MKIIEQRLMHGVAEKFCGNFLSELNNLTETLNSLGINIKKSTSITF